MKLNPILLALSTVLLLAGCTRMKIACSAEPGYEFARIQTYHWTEAPDATLAQNGAYLDIGMQQALNNQLAAKGWRQVLAPTNATVLATYYIMLASHEEYASPAADRETDFAGGLVYDSEGKKWNYEKHPPQQQVYTVEDATLHFTLTDTATGEPAWNGSLETWIDRSASEEDRQEHYRRIARKLTGRIP